MYTFCPWVRQKCLARTAGCRESQGLEALTILDGMDAASPLFFTNCSPSCTSGTE